MFAEARSIEQLKQMVEEAIGNYNERRYPSSIGYQTPLAFTYESLGQREPRIRAVS